MRHVLKIEDIHYENIRAGRKKFEIRYNDRGYQAGDEIKFCEVIDSFERDGLYKIVFVHSGYGMEKSFVVLGIEEVEDSPKGGGNE